MNETAYTLADAFHKGYEAGINEAQVSLQALLEAKIDPFAKGLVASPNQGMEEHLERTIRDTDTPPEGTGMTTKDRVNAILAEAASGGWNRDLFIPAKKIAGLLLGAASRREPLGWFLIAVYNGLRS